MKRILHSAAAYRVTMPAKPFIGAEHDIDVLDGVPDDGFASRVGTLFPDCTFLATLRRMNPGREVVVYSRKGCHLCEIVKESLSKLQRRGGFTWREVDVDGDDSLRRQYSDEVPVVFIDGRKAFKYHMDEREFLRKLAC
jgi:glutaredoxin